MGNDSHAIILMDEVSKDVIKTSVASFGAAGFKFIDSLSEINDEMAEGCKKLVILEGFAHIGNSFVDLEMYKELYGLKIFFIGSKKYFPIYSKVAQCFEVELATISVDAVSAAIFNDKSVEENDVPDHFDMKETAEHVVESRGEISGESTKVAADYLTLLEKITLLERENRKLGEENRILQMETDKIAKDRERLLLGYREMIDGIANMNTSLKRYEAIFTKDIYDKVRLHDFVNKPLVLYFKEYEDFINLNQLLETLFNVFRLQSRKSVKVLRLFDSTTSRKILTLPKYYHVVQNSYLVSDVVKHDFVAKTGDHRRILEKLLTNDIGMDVLIIVDSKDFDDIVLSGSPLGFNLCREIEHRKIFGLAEGNTIMNEGDLDSDLFWGMYDTSGKNEEETFLYLSARPVIKHILGLSRIYEQTV